MRPFDVEEVRVEVSKHFRNTWMRKWGWDQSDLREAIRNASRVVKVGRKKYEVFVRKRGAKKLVVVHEESINEIFVITGTEG